MVWIKQYCQIVKLYGMVLQQNEMKHRLFLKIATVVLVYHEKLE